MRINLEISFAKELSHKNWVKSNNYKEAAQLLASILISSKAQLAKTREMSQTDFGHSSSSSFYFFLTFLFEKICVLYFQFFQPFETFQLGRGRRGKHCAGIAQQQEKKKNLEKMSENKGQVRDCGHRAKRWIRHQVCSVLTEGCVQSPAPTPRSSKLPRPPDPGDLKPPLPPMYSPIKQYPNTQGFYWFVYFCRLLLVSALTVNFHWLPNLRLAVYTVKNLTYQRKTLAFFPDFWEGV